MSAIPKLTEATAIAYTIQNVRSGFVANGQIDPLTNSVPSLLNILHTYRGTLEGTCLADKERLVQHYFQEMYTNGRISESSFDQDGIPKDRDSKGMIVARPDSIHMENRHRAKILSSKMQIRQRRHFLDNKRMKEYLSKKSCFEIEEKEHSLNLQCERKFVAIIYAFQNDQPFTRDLVNSPLIQQMEYDAVSKQLSAEALIKFKDKVYKDEFRAFVRVRTDRCISGDRINFNNVPNKNKETLIVRCVSDRDKPITQRLIPVCPVAPDLLEPLMSSHSSS